MSSPSAPPSLDSLPYELRNHILSVLSVEPPRSYSTDSLRRLPSHDLASEDGAAAPLKSLSRVDSKWRTLSRPWLFRHARLERQDQDQFRAFIREHGLGRYVRSVVVVVVVAVDLTTVPDNDGLSWWQRLLLDTEPATFTVLASPQTIADMIACRLDQSHSWAFRMPLQILQLRQGDPSRQLRNPEQEPQQHQHQHQHQHQQTPEKESILAARPWTEMLFNEGSSLRPYGHYEYFQLRVPSFLDTWGTIAQQRPAVLPYSVSIASRLTSFDYVAIFPFCTHTNLLCAILYYMNNLRRMSVQLAPTPDSTIFEQERRRSSALDPSDPWMELETGYRLIASRVASLGYHGSLVEFQTHDLQRGALTEDIFRKFALLLLEPWEHDGKGLWIKKPIHIQQTDRDLPAADA